MASPPKAPDPYVLADAQKKLNQSSQRGSMIDQANPYGSLTYEQTGTAPDGTPIYKANSKLSSEQQGLLDTLQGTQQSSGTAGGTLMSGVNNRVNADGMPDFSTQAGGLTRDLLSKETEYLNPQFDYQINQLDTKLRNQGITPDSPAYKQQMMDLQGNQNRAITGFLAQAEPQAFQQAVQNYTQPISIAQQLAGFASPQSLAQPGTPALGAANMTSAKDIFSNALGQSNYTNSLISGLGSAAGSLYNSGALGSIGSSLAGMFGSGAASSAVPGGEAVLAALPLL